MRNKMTQRMCRSKAGEKGFTLIEGVISILILSIGMLGMAALQDIALTRNVDASELSQATNLATDMMERIRYNAPNVTDYNGIDTLVAGTQPPVAQPMARGDYAQWKSRLETMTSLPGVQGFVTVTAQGPAALDQQLVTVQVNWTGRFINHSLFLSSIMSPSL